MAYCSLFSFSWGAGIGGWRRCAGSHGVSGSAKGQPEVEVLQLRVENKRLQGEVAGERESEATDKKLFQ